MTIKYEACFREVKAVEVERETDASVWIDGRRKSKDSTWRPLFDTPAQAWDWIIEREMAEVESAERSLKYRKEQLDDAIAARAEALTVPSEDTPR